VRVRVDIPRDEKGVPTYTWTYDIYVVQNATILDIAALLSAPTTNCVYTLLAYHAIPLRKRRIFPHTRPYVDREELINCYKTLCLSVTEIVSIFGLSYHEELYCWLWLYNISVNRPTTPLSLDDQELTRLHLVEGLSARQIANLIHERYNKVYYRLLSLGIHRSEREQITIDRTAVAELIAQGATLSDLVQATGESISSLKRQMRLLGLATHLQSNYGGRLSDLGIGPDEMRELYEVDRMSLQDIADATGLDQSTISRALKRWEIKTRWDPRKGRRNVKKPD